MNIKNVNHNSYNTITKEKIHGYKGTYETRAFRDVIKDKID